MKVVGNGLQRYVGGGKFSHGDQQKERWHNLRLVEDLTKATNPNPSCLLLLLMVWETRLFLPLFTLCKSGSNFSEVAKFFNQFVKSSHLWALVWPSKPCFIPNLSLLVQSEWNWILFHETGYQFRRFAGSYFDVSLHLMKNTRGSQGTGKTNPKWWVDQFKWET
jgi:hypothetical protein